MKRHILYILLQKDKIIEAISDIHFILYDEHLSFVANGDLTDFRNAIQHCDEERKWKDNFCDGPISTHFFFDIDEK